MSEESGVGAGPISLPEGGGAIEGLGETFSPDLYTGTGNLTVPIDTPAGRNGFGPSLSLQYSTGNGNGPFGHGWGLSIPSVTRRTNDGVPVYQAGKDGFAVPGVEEMVPVEESPSATVYRPRTEGSFDRIRHVTGGTDDYWEIEATDGTVNVYGTPDSAGADPAVVADPADRSKVFAWKLTAMEDQFGNRVEYSYSRDRGHGASDDGSASDDAGSSGPAFDQLYPERVQYLHHDAGDPGHLVSVAFEYEERPDPFSRRRAGFEIRTRKRCSRIAVRSHPDGTARELRSYEFTYRDERDDAPANGLSQLVQVAVVGHDGDETQSFPPLEFGYTAFDPGDRSFDRVTGSLPARSLASAGLELADLDGNGLPDVVEIDGTVRYWENLGDGEFDEPQPMDRSPAGLRLADRGVRLLDIDGDGRIDLQATKDGLAGYFPHSFDGGWSEDSFRPYETAPNVPFADPSTSLIDLNGDGVTDAVHTGQTTSYFRNDPDEGWTETRAARDSEFPDVDLANERVRLADMSGDGLLDVALVNNGRISYWPNYGHGRWGEEHRMSDSPRFPAEYDPSRLYFGDVDGDGAADLVYLAPDDLRLWLNQSGNGWSDGVTIQGTPPVADRDAVRLIDLYGQGISGVFWGPVSDGTDRAAHFLDFTGGTKPYLLNHTANNMGSTTKIEYESSTHFAIADADAGEPWKSTLPSPTWVVSRLETYDRVSFSMQTTAFEYRHGYWDGVEREFRGFGMVEKRDSERFESFSDDGLHDDAEVALSEPKRYSPPRVTRTWFHQGPVGPPHDWRELDYEDEYWGGDPGVLSRPTETETLLTRGPRGDQRDAVRALRGRKLRTEVYGEDDSPAVDRPYTVTEYAYGVHEEVSTPDGEPGVYYPFGVGKRQTQWERGDDPKTSISYTGKRDQYGQPTSKTKVACPRGWTPGAGDEMTGYETTHTELEYAQRDDATAYIVDRTARTTTYEITPDGPIAVDALLAGSRDGSLDREPVRESLTHYDGEAFRGLPLGEIGEYGATARTEELVLTARRISEAYPDGTPAALQTGTDAFPQAYPDDYVESLQSRAGYHHRDGSGWGHGGWYANTTRNAYDFHPSTAATSSRGLTVATKDAVGNRTDIDHDRFDLKPVRVENAAGLETTATYNYRTFQPATVTDPNDNRTRYAFTPLGLLDAKAEMGAPGEEVGDTLDQPTASFEYNLRSVGDADDGLASEGITPSYVEITRRNRHRWDVLHAENERRAANDDDPLDEAGVESLFANEYDTHPERFGRVRVYSDGFGRTVQKREVVSDVSYEPADGGDVLASDQSVSPGPIERITHDETRVAVSGWKTYNNKGKGVEKYEPFYATGLEFESRREAQTAADGAPRRKVEVRYDPLGRSTRTINPDGSESVTVRGVPHELSAPTDYRPTPWQVYEYDPNDNAGRTHPASSRDFEHHWNTPTSKRFDPKGRPIEIVERAREDPDVPDSAIETHVTRKAYDVTGNQIEMWDPLGRSVVRETYDLTDNRLRNEPLDGGPETVVLDAAGNQLERTGPRGELTLQQYDGMNRPTSLWARDASGESVTRRQRILYAESDASSLSTPEAKQRNALGDVWRHYDAAGRVTFERYDFRGNTESKRRRVLADATALEGPVDWTPDPDRSLSDLADATLEAKQYQTDFDHDAQDRRTHTRYPRDVRGQRTALDVEYTRSGRLAGATLASYANGGRQSSRPLLEAAAYTPTGQPRLLAYGNDQLATYAYDERTVDLARQRIEGVSRRGAALIPDGDVHRDLGYEQDRAGNVREIRHRSPGSGVADTPHGRDELVREFDYDALYRLTKATGRACTTLSEPSPHGSGTPCGHEPPGAGTPHVTRQNAPDHTSKYAETYEYDPGGNLTRIHHASADGGSWERRFGIGDYDHQSWEQTWQANQGRTWPSAPNNELTHVNAGRGGAPTHTYDDAGNLEQDRHSKYQWNHGGKLVRYSEDNGTGSSVEARYLYDSAGSRVKKIVDKGPTHREVTVTVAGTFEHRREETPDGTATNRIGLRADGSTIAQLRVDPPGESGTLPSLQYQFSDHLGNSTLAVDGDGSWINYEEYTPYGETMFGGYRRKRYRFNGKERDAESGLYYHGARYFAPWLARWTRPDPAGTSDGWNQYRFVKNNPMRFADPTGQQSQEGDQSNGSSSSSANSGGSGDASGTGDTLGDPLLEDIEADVNAYFESLGYDTLAEGATEHIESQMKAHKSEIEDKGDDVGKYYGGWSTFAGMSWKAKKNLLESWGVDNPADTLDNMERSSCIGWVLSTLEAGYKQVDESDAIGTDKVTDGDKSAMAKWDEIEKTVKDNGSVGHVLLQELKKRGWKIVYVNADTSKTKKRFNNAGVPTYNSSSEYQTVKGGGSKYGLTPDAMVVNFESDTKSANASNLRKLKQADFFVGMAEGGSHTFAGVDGKVNEFHVGKGPKSKNIIENRSFDSFWGENNSTKASWQSGFVAIPPGDWDE